MKEVLVTGSVVWFSPVQPCGEGNYQVEIREFNRVEVGSRDRKVRYPTVWIE